MTEHNNAARVAAACAVVSLAALAVLDGDEDALAEAIAAAVTDGVLLEVASAAVQAYVGTMAKLIGPEKARATVERSLEAAELDLQMAGPAADPGA